MSVDFKIISNYAQALFKTTKEASIDEKVLDQILVLVNVLKESRSVREAFYSPVVDRVIKIKLIDLVSKKYKFEEISKQFLYVLIKNSRFMVLEQISIKFSELIADSKGIAAAEVLSASKLGKKEINALKSFLEAKLEKKVNLETNIDPSLIGGIVIKYGSSLIDCSVQGALGRIQNVAGKSKT